MKLIDVSVLKEWIEDWFTKNQYYHPYVKNGNIHIPITELYDILEQMPSAHPDADARHTEKEQAYMDGYAAGRQALYKEICELMGHA